MAVPRKATTATVAVLVVAVLFAAEPASAWLWSWGPIPWPLQPPKLTWPPFQWPPHFPKPCFIDCWDQVINERHYHRRAVNYFVVLDWCTDMCSDWSHDDHPWEGEPPWKHDPPVDGP